MLGSRSLGFNGLRAKGGRISGVRVGGLRITGYVAGIVGDFQTHSYLDNGRVLREIEVLDSVN